MLTTFFWLINFTLLAVSLFSLWLSKTERSYYLAILQSLLLLPIIVGEYQAAILNYLPAPEGFVIFFVSQNLFLIVWSIIARNLYNAMTFRRSVSAAIQNLLHIFFIVLILTVIIYQVIIPGFVITEQGLKIAQFRPVYLSSLLCLLIMLFMAWQLDAFWQQLPQDRRGEYGLFAAGGALICAVQGGVASYLVTFLKMTPGILLVQSIFLLIAWGCLVIATLRYRLPKRELIISRKIAYSFVTPSLFAIYFVVLGNILLIIHLNEYPFKLVVFWILVGAGVAGGTVLAVSESARQYLKYFISTHFYANKYEYRDEWLAFSIRLQNANSKAKVIDTLYQVLLDTLYTKDIWIWAGSEANGLEIFVPTNTTNKEDYRLAGNDPVISHLRQQPCLDRTRPLESESEMLHARLNSLPAPQPILFVPLIADGQLVGCIGLGSESTGGRYAQDDFDLLTILGSQAASALIAINLNEEAGRLRERRALHNISAFLLHDIKNASSILSMVHANAAEHMDNPEFRKDMLIAIEDALNRMEKAQTSLGMLRDRLESVWQNVDVGHFLEALTTRFSRRLPGLEITLYCLPGIVLRTDPQHFETVLENLLLNAYEAGSGSSQVRIVALPSNNILAISIANNGPAIPERLLPDQLFNRFVSDKPNGSGIGLWQARLILQRLGATITADNPAAGGARFTIHFPFTGSSRVTVDQPCGM
jgi:putative PEP-CTERM system histidine kinase